jgi:hypothetical protein
MNHILENIKQQLLSLDNPKNFKLKIGSNDSCIWVPASHFSDPNFSTYASVFENKEIKLVDIRDLDDEERMCELNMEYVNTENDSELNKIYRTFIMLPRNKRINSNLIDRSGIFLETDSITIPIDTHTVKDYNTIMDETAQLYSNIKPIILWSGGVDSTAILAAFVKNNINFSVAFDRNSKIESPIMYEYISNNFECLPLDTYNVGVTKSYIKKEDVTNRILLTGDCNDQIFPILQHHLVVGNKYFKYHVMDVGTDAINDFYKTPVDDSVKYMPARDYFGANHSRIHQCDISQSNIFYDSVIAPKLNQFPIATEYAYQVNSYFRFIFKYQLHLDKLNNLNTTNNLNNIFKAFYHTDDFQKWSITNFENNYEIESTTYLTMKTRVKQYSYDVFQINEILEQHKRGSGFSFEIPPISISNI